MIARLSALLAWSLIALAALATRCPGAAALFAVALTAAFAHALDLARSLIFPRRKGGAQWLASPRARLAVCRMFRPDGNALDGYVPGSALRRFADAEVSP